MTELTNIYPTIVSNTPEIAPNKPEVAPNNPEIKIIETFASMYYVKISDGATYRITIKSNLNRTYIGDANAKNITISMLDEIIKGLPHKHEISFTDKGICQLKLNFDIHNYSTSYNIKLTRYVIQILDIDVKSCKFTYKYNGHIYGGPLDINQNTFLDKKMAANLVISLLNDIKNGTHNDYYLGGHPDSHGFNIYYMFHDERRFITLNAELKDKSK